MVLLLMVSCIPDRPQQSYARRCKQSHRLVHMRFRNLRAQRQFCQRFANSNNGLKLTDGEGNGGPFIVVPLDLLDLLAQRNEV